MDIVECMMAGCQVGRNPSVLAAHLRCSKQFFGILQKTLGRIDRCLPLFNHCRRKIIVPVCSFLPVYLSFTSFPILTFLAPCDIATLQQMHHNEPECILHWNSLGNGIQVGLGGAAFTQIWPLTTLHDCIVCCCYVTKETDWSIKWIMERCIFCSYESRVPV